MSAKTMTKAMECKNLFEIAYRENPDPFFNQVIPLIGSGKNCCPVKTFYSLCYNEANFHANKRNEHIAIPYEEPKKWNKKMILLSQSMIQWVHRKRVGAPQKIEQKPKMTTERQEIEAKINKLTSASTEIIPALLIEITRNKDACLTDHSAMNFLFYNPIVNFDRIQVEDFSFLEFTNFIQRFNPIQPKDKDSLLKELTRCCGGNSSNNQSTIPYGWLPIEQIFRIQHSNSSSLSFLHTSSGDSAFLLFLNCITRPVIQAEIESMTWSLLGQNIGHENVQTLKLRFKFHSEPPIPPPPLVAEVIRESAKSHTFHPSQVEIAQVLFEQLKNSPNYNKQYSGVDFRIITPPRTTLTSQTEERLISLLLEMLAPLHNEKSIRDKVMSTLQFRDGNAGLEFQQLERDIFSTDSHGNRKMMLIIHDECHWGIEKNQQVDILFNGASHNNGQFPNPNNPLCEPNVFIVHVSATGWNFDVKAVNHNVISWKTIPPGYTSQESYATGANKADRLLVDNEFDTKIQLLTQMYTSSPMKKYIPTVALMVDYALECFKINYTQTRWLPTKHTTWLFNHFDQAGNDNKNSTVLIRIQKGGLQTFFLTWLKFLRSILPPNHGMRKFKIASPSSSESEIKIDDSFENSAINQYPTIVVVVEKAKMGDTLPNLSAFDLRARYKSDGCPSCYSGFVQDVGRCFGYRSTPPTMILTQQGCNILSGFTYDVDRFLLKSDLLIKDIPQIADFSRAGVNMLLPSKRSMWYRVLMEEDQKVLRHVRENRLLLLARPQIGKTGAFIKLIQMIIEDNASLPESIVKGKYLLGGAEF
jgi:hypothetical protein